MIIRELCLIFLLFCMLFVFVDPVLTVKAIEKVTTSDCVGNNYLPKYKFPVVINTWPFLEAAKKAWEVLAKGGSSLDAIENGCTACEELQCNGTVGFGGSPDENGETTLDAMIMDGETHDIGAVGSLRRIKGAISVARKVMELTEHTLLVGSQATAFAKMLGFQEVNLTTPKSQALYKEWRGQNCQPNFWRNVVPDPTTSCGPYKIKESSFDDKIRKKHKIDNLSHDTIGMVAIDSHGCIAGGTSTNGAIHKIPGRVGDSPIPGSGTYVDCRVGAAAATGDGDIMMRFLPSFVTVEHMRQGLSPYDAAVVALKRIVVFHPSFSGAVIALSINGTFGGACYNLEDKDNIFQYSVGSPEFGGVKVLSVPCISNLPNQYE